jgi:REP element-mobilizing transposase RayT
MGRPKRTQFAGACYLLAWKGNNRQDLFRSNEDRRQFLSLLKGCKERFGLKIYAYSLLDGHVELLLETAHPNLAGAMRELGARYTRHFNRAHHASGHVFQGRYKSWLVEKETRLADMTRYVHLACARDGLRERPWRHPWTSCAAYVEAEFKDSLVDTGPILRRLGQARLQQSVRYLHTVKEAMKAGAPMELPAAGGAIGGEAFAHKMAERRAAPSPARAVPLEAARRVIAEVCSRRGISEENLLGRVQWRDVAAARREAVHRAWKEAGMGVSDLARLFSRTPSAVSQMIRSVETDQ